MIFRLFGCIALSAVLRYLLADALRAVFTREVVSESWIPPYLNMAGPDLLLFFLTGLILPFAFERRSVLKAAVVVGAAMVAIEGAFFALFSTFSADWRGYFVLSAPYFGVIIGLTIGVVVASIALMLVERGRASTG